MLTSGLKTQNIDIWNNNKQIKHIIKYSNVKVTPVMTTVRHL